MKKQLLRALTISALFIPASALAQSTLNRPYDPVVLEGNEVTPLLSQQVGAIVGFRWAPGWVQVPVQVDERAWVLYVDVYGNNPSVSFTDPTQQVLAYTDAGTFTGDDPAARFDDNDEVCFMAADAGECAPAHTQPPNNTLPGTGVEIMLTDPLDPQALGCVYLFASDGTLDPAAGQDYVSYTFALQSGLTYLQQPYDTGDQLNPENTLAETPHYRVHFADRWIRDRIHILSGNGKDILDRHKFGTPYFPPCTETDFTFSLFPGAFFANIDGPVRGIRSIVGAKSGRLLCRDHFFYAQREDVRTFYRVHEISAQFCDWIDFGPRALGMQYSNSRNVDAVTIDGMPDMMTPGVFTWELATGAQGSLMSTYDWTTDMCCLQATSFYSDNFSPPAQTCHDDGIELGATGICFLPPICNTDPGFNQPNPDADCQDKPFYKLESERSFLYAPPGANNGDAVQFSRHVRVPLVETIQAF